MIGLLVKIKIAMVIEYDGTMYFGWQKQRTFISIQEVLERALSKFANHKIEVITAGRTDSGVHARYQVVSFETTATRELYGWMRGVNALLPADIVIQDVAIVSNDFDARYSAISRTYKYYLYQNVVRSAVLNKKIGWYHADLDVEKIREASKLLIGRQDFSAFRASECQALTPVRDLSVLNITEHENIICFEITANAFLHHMIRNIVGAFVYIGNGKLSINGLNDIIISKNRKLAPPTFMPDGLYLTHVQYKEDIFKYKVRSIILL